METVLHARNITKRFPGVRALKDVSLEVKRGQVLALVGENGAGKSTLMKIISGVYQQDEGEIWLRGQPVTIRSPRDAQRQRISTIHQELLIVPHLSVAANICLSNLPTHLFPGYINKAAMNERASELMEQLGVKINPETPVTLLSVAERQLVEIAKALSHKADILVMDEPTSALND
ncbi:MAG: transporter related protein, partial [Firmicutes bacterium]|nr:transporter related protein [Bacillota bacterium]